ncbi:hypothetical protein LXD69_10040 [Flavobacterium sediminilitoris]|uniref:Bacteriophage CI repressor-like protein n=1 Tax=Flavobacterium sediminilitoris TaxID=2024526 RepID=A0ABY4HJG6_9FLAO|nr:MULTISPECIES: hypothetical protein [Flavobacterium]UOX32392.1 hypothetical protein LXD69_10040 [Flavobacterium sediminilitoris]
MSTGKRLTYYIEKQGFKKKEFCEKFGFEYNNLVSVMADKRPLGINILNQLHESLPNLNVHWLLYGEGTIEFNSENFQMVAEDPEIYSSNDPFEKTLLKYLEKKSVIEKINEIAKEKDK